MKKQTELSFQEAKGMLAQFDIKGTDIYLIDIIPLIEMIWADGIAQDGEIAILDDFIKYQVTHINDLTEYETITYPAAQKFAERFLKERPSKELLKTLRNLMLPLRLHSTDQAHNKRVRDSVLSACLDIAADAATDPLEMNQRICKEEKALFFEIVDTLKIEEED